MGDAGIAPLSQEEVETQRGVLSAQGHRCVVRELVLDPSQSSGPELTLQHHGPAPLVGHGAISRAG